MVIQCVGRNIKYAPLQILKVAYGHYLASVLGVAYHKVAEAEVVHDSLAEVYRQLFGVLVKECASEFPGRGGVFHFRRFHNHRQCGIAVVQILHQPQAGSGVLDTTAFERHIGNHAQKMLSVALVKRHSLFVIAGEHHLRTSAHAQHLFVLVQGLGTEGHRLLEQEFVYMREYRRVKAHRIFHQQYHLHAYIVNVGGIEPVFEQLYDGK